MNWNGQDLKRDGLGRRDTAESEHQRRQCDSRTTAAGGIADWQGPSLISRTRPQ